MASSSKKAGFEGSRVVSFRLDESYAERLEEAAKRLKTSPGDAARRAVLGWLEDPGESDVRKAVEEIRKAQARSEALLSKSEAALTRSEGAIKGLQNTKTASEESLAALDRKLSDSIQMLLVNAGKLSADQAKDFARQYLIDGGGKKR